MFGKQDARQFVSERIKKITYRFNFSKKRQNKAPESLYSSVRQKIVFGL